MCSQRWEPWHQGLRHETRGTYERLHSSSPTTLPSVPPSTVSIPSGHEHFRTRAGATRDGTKSPESPQKGCLFSWSLRTYIIFKSTYFVQDYQWILICKEPYSLNLLFLQVHVNIYLGDGSLPDDTLRLKLLPFTNKPNEFFKRQSNLKLQWKVTQNSQVP